MTGSQIRCARVDDLGHLLTCLPSCVSAGALRAQRRLGFCRRLTRASLPWLVALAVTAISPAALAREPTPEDRTTARELAFEGHRALQTGDYALAADRFQRAESLVHAPTLLVDLGRSYVGLGQLVKAHEAFQQVLREGVAADAPAPWRRALAVAQEQDTALEPRLAWVTLSIEGAANPRLKLDDEELSPASLGVRRAVDPGRRTIVATADGFLPVHGSIDLSEGETREMKIVLERDPNYKPPTVPRVAPPKRVILVEAPASRPRTSAYVAYGVGGTGLLLSGVSTVMMLRARANLEQQCTGRSCPPSAANDHSTYQTFGTLAAVGLGVGLAGVGVGTYLLFSNKTDDVASHQASVTARIAPGYVGLSGRF
jgi:hypothetical protein